MLALKIKTEDFCLFNMFFINFQVLAKSLMLVIQLVSSASVYKYSEQIALYLNIVTSYFI